MDQTAIGNRVPFIDLTAHHEPLRTEFERAINEVIDSGAFAGGPFVEQFEEQFAAYCGTKYAIGVGSGTEALWLSLLASDIGPGDEVITVPNTFMATAEAITYSGARPVFVDVDDCTYTLDPAGLKAVLTPRTRAIIPVHLFCQPADLAPILDFAAAGAVWTNDENLYDRIRTLRDHGQIRKYHHAAIGWNCRMDGLQAAVLSIKLKHLDRGNSLRRKHAAIYDEAFAGMEDINTPVVAHYAEHVYHIYAVRVQERDHAMWLLGKKGIQFGIHYPVPIHRQKAYHYLGYGIGAFPVAEMLAHELLSLPMFPELTRSQIDSVVYALKTAALASALV